MGWVILYIWWRIAPFIFVFVFFVSYLNRMINFLSSTLAVFFIIYCHFFLISKLWSTFAQLFYCCFQKKKIFNGILLNFKLKIKRFNWNILHDPWKWKFSQIARKKKENFLLHFQFQLIWIQVVVLSHCILSPSSIYNFSFSTSKHVCAFFLLRGGVTWGGSSHSNLTHTKYGSSNRITNELRGSKGKKKLCKY
jgi:hypothetical protein